MRILGYLKFQKMQIFIILTIFFSSQLCKKNKSSIAVVNILKMAGKRKPGGKTGRATCVPSAAPTRGKFQMPCAESKTQ
jgi:hypothetical protein